MLDTAAQTLEPSAPAETSARERMGILRRMSEIGLRMAERLDRQSEIAALRAEAEALPHDVREDSVRRLEEMARAFTQVSRAVCVCLALEDRIERAPPIPEAQGGGRPFGPELVCAVPRESRLTARRRQVESAVRDAIDASATLNPARVGDLCRRLDDILDHEVAAVDLFLTRPVDEIIAQVCVRLGLNPELASCEVAPDKTSPLWGEPVGEADRGGLATEAARKVPNPQRPSCEPPTAGLRPPASPRGGRSESLKQASPDASDPSIPCRERSLPVRAGQGRALRARREAAGLRPDLEQPEPASRLACMGPRTVRGPGP